MRSRKGDTMKGDTLKGEKDKTGFHATIKNLLNYMTKWRSVRTSSSSEDYIHPSLTVQTQPPVGQRNSKGTFFLSRNQQDELKRQSSGLTNSKSKTDHHEKGGRKMKGTSISPTRSQKNDNDFNFNDSTNVSQLTPCSPLDQREKSTAKTDKSSTTSVSSKSTGVSKSNIKTELTVCKKFKVLCCDKCDGEHETDDCPHFKKKRDLHIDAQKNGWKLVGGSSNLPGAVLRVARIIPQAGDGSCLFHSMSYGMKDGSNATSLRRDICEYIQQNPNTTICDTPLSDWVKWDSGTSCVDYARRMKSGAWGGGIEMACMSQLKGCNVHVYESQRLGGFKRISAFDHPIKPELKKTVRVLYRGGVHYDALVTI
jgi:hypothetical protein